MNRQVLGPVVILILLVLLAFSPIFSGQFLHWDDYTLVLGNSHLHLQGMNGLCFFWTKPYKGLYTPLAYSVWMILALFGRPPSASLFHALNFALHLGSSVLLFFLLLRLTKNQLAALLGAAIFAVHPLQTEPVAWIAGMNNVLAGMLSIAALLAYSGQTRRSYFIATFLFLLALLAKPTAVVVPLIAVVIDLLLLNRSIKLSMLRISPWIAMAIIFSIIAKRVQPASDQFAPALSFRAVVASDAIAFYLAKLAWPINLSPDYGRTPAWLAEQVVRFYSWILPAVVLIIAAVFRKRWPFGLAGVSIFILALLPVLGLMPFDFQEYSTVADRYAYLAMIGAAIVVAGFVASVQGKISMPITIAAIVACGILTFIQSQYWHDSASLYDRAVTIDPTSLMANRGIAAMLNDSGRPDLAEPFAQRAVQYHPDSSEARKNLAAVFMAKGQFAQAADQYQHAVLSHPSDPAAHYSLAGALAQMNQLDQALHEAQLAVQLDPRDEHGQTNLANILLTQGKTAEAIEHYKAALAVNPNFPPAIAGLRQAEQGPR